MNQEDIDEMNKAQLEAGQDHTKEPMKFSVPSTGPCTMRFTHYIEFGLQKATNPTFSDAYGSVLGFEICSKNREYMNKDKAQRPVIFADCNIPPKGQAAGSKSMFKPLFEALNYDKSARVITECLGNAYVGEITHEEDKKVQGKMYPRIKARGKPWNIRPAIKIDPEEPENSEVMNVAEAIMGKKMFCWEPSFLPDERYLKSWDELYQPGVTKDGKSKNRWQEKIMVNLEWEGSRLRRLIDERANGVSSEVDEDDFM